MIVFFFCVSCFSLSVSTFICVSCLFMVSCFCLSRCLGCFRYYVFKVQVFLFLYSNFTCFRLFSQHLHVVGVF